MTSGPSRPPAPGGSAGSNPVGDPSLWGTALRHQAQAGLCEHAAGWARRQDHWGVPEDRLFPDVAQDGCGDSRRGLRRARQAGHPARRRSHPIRLRSTAAGYQPLSASTWQILRDCRIKDW